MGIAVRVRSSKRRRGGKGIGSCGAFYFHALDDRPELVDLALEHRVLLGGGRSRRLGTDLAQALRRLRMLDRSRGFLLQALDDFARRLRRREKPVPAVGLEERKALLAHRGYIGQVGRAVASVRRQRLDLARLDVAE